MAFSYGFYNSKDGDRRYNATHFGSLFDGILNDGVFDNIGDAFLTKAGTGMQVIVGSGKAWFNRTWNLNDADYPLTIEEADLTRPRIDAVVLVVDSSDAVRTNKLMIKKGTPNVEPEKPVMTTDNKTYWEHPLAWVTVKAAVESITSADIENQVGRSPTPFVTGILETVDISELYSQWGAQFDEWFENIKLQLTDNVVTNLQKQIEDRVKISDKASTSEAQSGSDNTKWMTPSTTKAAITNNAGFVQNQSGTRMKIRTSENLPPIKYDVPAYNFGSDDIPLGGTCKTKNYGAQFMTGPGNSPYNNYLIVLYKDGSFKRISMGSTYMPIRICGNITGTDNLLVWFQTGDYSHSLYKVTVPGGSKTKIIDKTDSNRGGFIPCMVCDQDYSIVAYGSSNDTLRLFILRHSTNVVSEISVGTYQGDLGVIFAEGGHALYYIKNNNANSIDVYDITMSSGSYKLVRSFSGLSNLNNAFAFGGYDYTSRLFRFIVSDSGHFYCATWNLSSVGSLTTLSGISATGGNNAEVNKLPFYDDDVGFVVTNTSSIQVITKTFTNKGTVSLASKMISRLMGKCIIVSEEDDYSLLNCSTLKTYRIICPAIDIVYGTAMGFRSVVTDESALVYFPKDASHFYPVSYLLDVKEIVGAEVI